MLELTNERILVTGGSGFLGRHLCELLRSDGCRNLFTPRREDYDLTDRAAVKRMYAAFEPTVVIHLAARVGGIGANRDNPGLFFHDNLVMGMNLIDVGAQRAAPLRKFVQLGTVCAYPKHTPVPFREDALWDGFPEETNAPYGIAKKALLVMLQAYRAQYGFPGIYLLPVNLYGPGDNFDLKTSHVIPAMIRKFGDCPGSSGLSPLSLAGDERKRGQSPKSGTVPLWGDGSPSREFLYVRDCARAIVEATRKYEGAAPVNLGSGREITMRDLAELIRNLTGSNAEIKWDANMPNGQPRRCLDTSRAQEAFNWHAETKLEDGLKTTIAWWQAQRKWGRAHVPARGPPHGAAPTEKIMLFTKARLPVEPAIREWIDEQWPWLVDKLNMGNLAEHAVIEPTNDYFPDHWAATQEAVQALFARVVEYTEIAPARVELALIDQQEEMPPALVRKDEKFLLPLEVSELRDPTVAVAILARKLALLRLMDAGLDLKRDDLPLLMDLACVVLGLGIFNANAAVPKVPR